MKTRSNFFPTLFAAAALVFLANCSGNQNGDKDSAPHDENATATGAGEEGAGPRFQVDEKFQEQIASVFTAYLDVKEALVSADATKVSREATETLHTLEKVDMNLVSGPAHHDWMNFREPMKNSLTEIERASGIEAQRKAFSALTAHLYKTIKAFGLGRDEAYYEYCPMAFNNEGAYWLSDDKKIRNPYFGDKMLTCGEVKEKLQ